MDLRELGWLARLTRVWDVRRRRTRVGSGAAGSVTSETRRHSFSLVLAVALLAAAPASDSQGAQPERYHEKSTAPWSASRCGSSRAAPRRSPMKAASGRSTSRRSTSAVTEVTWDMYDVFALRLDRGADRGAADAVARPSHPYGAPDYGWGHAGFPAISVTRQAAEAFCDGCPRKPERRIVCPRRPSGRRAAALATGAQPLAAARRDALAWHRGNASARTHAVGTATPGRVGAVRSVRQRRPSGSLPAAVRSCCAAARSATPPSRSARRREPCRTRAGTKATRSCRRAGGGCPTDRLSDSGW